MSQQLTPVSNGIVTENQTTIRQSRINTLSPQYVEINNLESRPTEWVPGGRPIYRRLPAASETYQIDFFNLVNESNILGNTFVKEGIEKVGYVYLPYGASINGSYSVEVISSENNKTLLVQPGVLVWEHGKTEVLPTIIDLEVIDVRPGKYDLSYQLLYDDSPIPQLYSVDDFSLSGMPLNIISSTDSVTGWRYPAVNAFLNELTEFWSNKDGYFPSYSQPPTAFIQWKSDLGHAYSKVILRCPSGTSYTGTADLSYVNGATVTPIKTSEISKDSTSQYFEFVIDESDLQTGWNVSFSDASIAVESITVSGLLTLLQPPASPTPRARLVMYASGTSPKTYTNSNGEEVLATYCPLAEIDTALDYTVVSINDTRIIIHRDYTPVADWLTSPFDQDLINLYEQVSEYSVAWMSPTRCLDQEYANLSTDQIQVEA